MAVNDPQATTAGMSANGHRIVPTEPYWQNLTTTTNGFPMKMIEPTFRRCLAIWWAFVWRGFVLFLPFQVVVMIIMGVVFTKLAPAAPGAQVDPVEAQAAAQAAFAWFPLIWLVVMAGVVISGALAVRWMLRKQRWTDFFVALVPVDDPRN